MSDLSNIEKRNLERLFDMDRVRNEQSFAHDNQVLNYDESLLIFNHVASAIRFIEAVEQRISNCEKHNVTVPEQEEDVPF